MTSTVYFNGRLDGLGNRIEQLIHLEAYCAKHGVKGVYYWRQHAACQDRKYPILVACENITIEDEANSRPNTVEIDVSKNEWSKQAFQEAAKRIRYVEPLESQDPYIAVHIRSTDKLYNRGKDEFSFDFFKEKFNRTVAMLNTIQTKVKLTITSDDPRYKKLLIDNLNPHFQIVEPFKSEIGHDVYRDFFALVHATQIIMVPKFSSFSACASLIGGNTLLSHCDEHDTNLYRYKCNVLRC